MKGHYGEAGAEYRAQQDTYDKIISGPLDSNSLGPQYFQIYQKNGQILSFGIDVTFEITPTPLAPPLRGKSPARW